MSTDITIYEDKDIHFAATCGGWGIRFYISNTMIPGLNRPSEGRYGSDLVTSGQVDDMIAILAQIRDDLRRAEDTEE